MPLFRGEAPQLSKVIFDRIGTPLLPLEGTMWNDATLSAIQALVNGQQGSLAVNPAAIVTPVTAANPTVATALQTYAVPPGALNAVGKGFYIFASGLYSTAAVQTPTITIALQLGGVTIASWTSGATTAAMTNFPWNAETYFVVTQKDNGTGNAQVESHGILNATLGAVAGGAETSYNDTNSAVIASIPLVAKQNLQFLATMSTGAAGNQVVQRMLILEGLA